MITGRDIREIQRDKTGTFRGAMGGEGGNGAEKRPWINAGSVQI